MLELRLEQFKMYKLAEIFGLTHRYTVKQSEKIDRMILEYYQQRGEVNGR